MKSDKEYRFKLNPEEERIFKAFVDNRKDHSIYTFIGNVCFNDGYEATDRDIKVFLNAIQWLGSHVGQCFLRDLGYTIGKEEIKP